MYTGTLHRQDVSHLIQVEVTVTDGVLCWGLALVFQNAGAIIVWQPAL